MGNGGLCFSLGLVCISSLKSRISYRSSHGTEGMVTRLEQELLGNCVVITEALQEETHTA